MSELWAVTAYFNPLRYATRLANFRAFRERLSLPLLAVELGFDGVFDLGPGDADLLLRRTGRDVLWHKELLLNEAVRALPASCTKVAWLDADIVFADPGWSGALEALLERHRLVQAFTRFRRLGPEEPIPAAGARPADGSSLAHLMREGLVPDSHFRIAGSSFRYGYSPGLAWAARRGEIEAIGFYELLILGSGDRALLSAACGRQQDFVVRLGMNERQARHYLAWADRAAAWAEGDVAALPGDICHLWHGDVRDRAYVERYQQLAEHDFDPEHDVAREEGGGLVWASEKPALHAFVRSYFERRREGPRLATGPC